MSSHASEDTNGREEEASDLGGVDAAVKKARAALSEAKAALTSEERKVSAGRLRDLAHVLPAVTTGHGEYLLCFDGDVPIR